MFELPECIPPAKGRRLMGASVTAVAKRGRQGMSLAFAAARFRGFNPMRRIIGAKRREQAASVPAARLEFAHWQHGDAQCKRNPGGWANNIWSAAPTPSGHANINLNNGNLNDKPDGNNNYVSAVL